MLSIISELSSFLLIHSLASISFTEKLQKGQTEGENAKIDFSELENAIISKVNDHNDSIRRYSHTGGAIHLSKATPLCAKFA